MYFARSQALPGKAYLEALPQLRIQEAEPRGIHSQAEPGNDKREYSQAEPGNDKR